MVVSIGFSSTISLACGALKKKYFSWVVDGYHKEVYDYSINNPWNTVGIADNALYKELLGLGISTVKYLPLYPNIIYNHCFYKDIDETENFLIWSEISEMRGIRFDQLDNLKDSSKGYIVGMSISREHNLISAPLYDIFADYVKEDICSKYPLAKDSYESIGHKYDYEYLFPAIQAQLTFPYYIRLLNEWDNYEKLYVATEQSNHDEDDKIINLKRNELSINDIMKYKIVVFLPGLFNNGLITTDMWNMMAIGKFIMCTEQVDFSVLGNSKPCTYKNTRELENKLRYYLNHADERRKISDGIKEKILSYGMLDERLKNIFQ